MILEKLVKSRRGECTAAAWHSGRCPTLAPHSLPGAGAPTNAATATPPDKVTTTTTTMASNVEQSQFFQQRRAKNELVVKGAHTLTATRAPLTHTDPPKFDLESYIANYAGTFSARQAPTQPSADPIVGHTRIDRLHHIGSHSPYLALDAYRLAIVEAKKGKNVDLYLQLAEEASGIAPKDPAAFTDTAWAEKKAQENQREQDRLEHELKSYKNNLIKESIRVCTHLRLPVDNWRLTRITDGQRRPRPFLLRCRRLQQFTQVIHEDARKLHLEQAPCRHDSPPRIR